MAVFSCFACRHFQPVDDSHIGRTATCPKCKATGTIVAATATVPDLPLIDPNTPLVHRRDGGPIGIEPDLENKKSRLRREWLFLDDPRLPLGFDLRFLRGIRVCKDYDDHSGEFVLLSDTSLVTRETAITALEVRHLTFDVWGSHVRTLSGTDIANREGEQQFCLRHTWRLYSENEAWEFYASISYVAQVRTDAGKIIRAETDTVLREARRFSENFSAEQLEPTPKKT